MAANIRKRSVCPQFHHGFRSRLNRQRSFNIFCSGVK
jgi:hypothetical protein